MAIQATMAKLAGDYQKERTKGFDNTNALYRAIQLYNGSLTKVTGKDENGEGGKTRAEWAQEYDLDYVNKVINFGTMLIS